MKTKIATSLLVILVAVSMIAGTTVAYFSHSANVTGNTFTSGTLQMLIDRSDADVSAKWVTADNWAPGETKTATLQFSNPGNVDAHHIYFSFTGNGDQSLWDNIYVTSVSEIFEGVDTGNQLATIAGQVGDGKAPMTLRELMSTQWYTWDNIPGSSNDAVIAAGDKNDYSITFEFTFAPGAGNDMQGKQCGFSLNCNATQNSPTAGMVCFH